MRMTKYLISIMAIGLCSSSVAQQCNSIEKEYRQAIVHLKVRKIHKSSGVIDDVEGTGFIVRSDGYLLTVNHVVEKSAGVDEVQITGSIATRNAFHIPILTIT